jgi:signal transduction histidine kinase
MKVDMAATQARSNFTQAVPFWKQIRTNLILLFVALALAPLAITTLLTTPLQFEGAQQGVTRQLESVSTLKIGQLELWLEETGEQIELIYEGNADKGLIEAVRDNDAEKIAELNEGFHDFIGSSDEFNRLFVYDPEGTIILSSEDADLGASIVDQPYFEGSLDEEHVQPPYFEAQTNEIRLIISTPIETEAQEVIGVFAGSINLDSFGEFMIDRTGLGEFGETYLISASNSFPLTPSRFKEEEDLLHIHDSEGIRRGINSERGSAVYENYEDTPRTVIGFYDYIPQLDAAILVEIDENEALGGVRAGVTASVGVLAISLIVASLVGYIYASRISEAITQLARTVQAFAMGNLDERTHIKSENEIGQLGAAFNDMADQLNDSIHSLEELIITAETAREQSERSDKVKSAFLASMSHELRTPLNAVINFTKFVQRGVMGPVTEKQTETLEKVVESGQHLLGLINDILDISKIESGALTIFKENHVDLKAIILKAVSTAETLVAGKPVRIITNIAADLPTIHADKQRILQVLLNMVSNASKFTDEGEITVNAYRQGQRMVEFYVKDTGPGIPNYDQDLVFQPFKQTQTGLRQGGGTGLGMPISKSLIEAHGGSMWLESVVGVGTSFFVRLPCEIPVDETLPSVSTIPEREPAL